MKKYIALVVLGAAVGAYAQSVVTTQRVENIKNITLRAADRIVCGVNPVFYEVAASSPSLVDYTVPAGKVLRGVSVLNATLE